VTATGGTIEIVLKSVMIVLAIVIVICVTARAGGLVTRGRPVDDFRIVLMAGGTWQVAAMILRLVGQSCVTVIHLRPYDRVVAQSTILRGVEVIRAFPSRLNTVVTG